MFVYSFLSLTIPAFTALAYNTSSTASSTSPMSCIAYIRSRFDFSTTVSFSGSSNCALYLSFKLLIAASVCSCASSGLAINCSSIFLIDVISEVVTTPFSATLLIMFDISAFKSTGSSTSSSTGISVDSSMPFLSCPGAFIITCGTAPAICI